MIKLIATDLDGTLLNTKKELPNNFKTTIDDLFFNNINFAVVTGRNYAGITNIFKTFTQPIYYICDNGAFIVKDNKVIHSAILSKKIVKELLDFFIARGNKNIMICGLKGTYYTNGDADFINRMENGYAVTTYVENLYEIDDDILKFSVCDLTYNVYENNYLPVKEKFKDTVSAHISAKMWLDIMNVEADKGIALKKIQEELSITKEETMAFGDYNNDIPLFSRAKYTYAMENAHDDLKAVATHIAPHCDEQGVTKTINSVVLKTKK